MASFESFVIAFSRWRPRLASGANFAVERLTAERERTQTAVKRADGRLRVSSILGLRRLLDPAYLPPIRREADSDEGLHSLEGNGTYKWPSQEW